MRPLSVDDSVQFRFEPGTGGVIKSIRSGEAWVATPKGGRLVPIDCLWLSRRPLPGGR